MARTPKDQIQSRHTRKVYGSRATVTTGLEGYRGDQRF